MATAATARGVARSSPAYFQTAGRAVHVRIHPQPLDISESREVLRVLQQYGEVIMFKNLKHEPNLHAANTALAIYQDANSAQKVINVSPLRFGLRSDTAIPQQSRQHGSTQSQRAPRKSYDNKAWLKAIATGSMSTPEASSNPTTFKELQGAMGDRSLDDLQANTIPTTPPRTPRPFTPNPTPSSMTTTSLPYPPTPSSPSTLPSTNHDINQNSKEFRLTVSRSVLNHESYIQRQHYYGGFKLDTGDAMADDLKMRVPVLGMADCQLHKGEAPLRKRIKMRENIANGRKTLKELWEEGQRDRENRASEDTSSAKD